MEHFYNGNEIAKIALFIDNTLEDNSFSDRKYKREIYRVEMNDAEDSYYSNVQRVKEDLSEKINGLKNTFEMDFIYGKSAKGYQLSWFEAHVLIFLLLYPSRKNTLISKIKNHKEYTYNEIMLFYDDLSVFLNDERFLKGGIWYGEECKIINDEIHFFPEKYEINLKIKKMKNNTLLKFYKDKIKNTSMAALEEGLNLLIPENEISKISLISQLEFFKGDSEIIYKENDLSDFNFVTDEYSAEDDYEIDDFIHSGILKGEDYRCAFMILSKFEKEIKDNIISLFENLFVDIIPRESAIPFMSLDEIQNEIINNDL